MLTSVPQTDPPGAGWQHWLDVPPQRYRLVETWRREWQQVEVLRLTEINPAMNVWGLYWRPLQRPTLEPEAVAR